MGTSIDSSAEQFGLGAPDETRSALLFLEEASWVRVRGNIRPEIPETPLPKLLGLVTLCYPIRERTCLRQDGRGMNGLFLGRGSPPCPTLSSEMVYGLLLAEDLDEVNDSDRQHRGRCRCHTHRLLTGKVLTGVLMVLPAI